MSIQVSPVSALENSDFAPSLSPEAFLAHWFNQRQDLPTQGLDAEAIAWLQGVRDFAAVRIQDLAFPTTRDEEWRFTDLSPLRQVQFTTFDESAVQQLAIADLQSFILPEAVNSRLVFVNGVYAPQLSSVENLPEGVVVANLLTTVQDKRLKSKESHYLGKQPWADDVFTALNTASLTDAAIVWVPHSLAVTTPIHILFLSVPGAVAGLSQTRCLVIAEANSSSSVIEEYGAIGQGVYCTNAVTEIWAEENAQIHHTRLQRDLTTAFHIGRTAIAQARDSRYTCNAVSTGAALSRHNLEVYQTGEQTQTVLNGLTLATGKQLADTHSLISYTKPHGSSRQLHKCIVDDQARAVFNGKVFVPKAAQLTDAGQLSRTLLLSNKARVDTKPQLEITADNVKCSHGATVSQLDVDEVFYLRSRGLDQSSAQQLLIYAFAAEVLTQIPVPSLRQQLLQSLR